MKSKAGLYFIGWAVAGVIFMVQGNLTAFLTCYIIAHLAEISVYLSALYDIQKEGSKNVSR